MLPEFLVWCRRYAAHFSAVGCRLLHYGKGNRCPFFIRWCRRYAAHFTAVGATLHTTARVNAARFSAVGAGVVLPILLLVTPPLTLRLG